jgi:hypothetical protein
MLTAKTCTKCHVEKPLAEFSKDPRGVAGKRAACKACEREHDRQRLERDEPERQRRAAYKRQWAARARARGVSDGKRSNQWRKDKPEHYKATLVVGAAVKARRIEKPPCEICGALRVMAYIPDFERPLESVRWLCTKHHPSFLKRSADWDGTIPGDTHEPPRRYSGLLLRPEADPHPEGASDRAGGPPGAGSTGN